MTTSRLETLYEEFCVAMGEINNITTNFPIEHGQLNVPASTKKYNEIAFKKRICLDQTLYNVVTDLIINQHLDASFNLKSHRDYIFMLIKEGALPEGAIVEACLQLAAKPTEKEHKEKKRGDLQVVASLPAPVNESDPSAAPKPQSVVTAAKIEEKNEKVIKWITQANLIKMRPVNINETLCFAVNQYLAFHHTHEDEYAEKWKIGIQAILLQGACPYHASEKWGHAFKQLLNEGLFFSNRTFAITFAITETMTRHYLMYVQKEIEIGKKHTADFKALQQKLENTLPVSFLFTHFFERIFYQQSMICLLDLFYPIISIYAPRNALESILSSFRKSKTPTTKLSASPLFEWLIKYNSAINSKSGIEILTVYALNAKDGELLDWLNEHGANPWLIFYEYQGKVARFSPQSEHEFWVTPTLERIVRDRLQLMLQYMHALSFPNEIKLKPITAENGNVLQLPESLHKLFNCLVKAFKQDKTTKYTFITYYNDVINHAKSVIEKDDLEQPRKKIHHTIRKLLENIESQNENEYQSMMKYVANSLRSNLLLNQKLAFLQGGHPRLGAGSPVMTGLFKNELFEPKTLKLMMGFVDSSVSFADGDQKNDYKL